MKVCVIGLGSWGARVATRARDMHEMRVVNVCDIDEQRVIDIARTVGANPHTSWHYALDDIDGVVVALPPGDARNQLVCDVIDAGINHVRIEKPLALSYADALALIEHAAAAQAHIVVGHTSVFQPMMPALTNAVADLTSSGVHMPVTFERLSTRAPAHAASISPVWDLMVHDFAIHQELYPAQWAMSPPTVLSAFRTLDGKFVAQIGHATFIASWSHPSSVRGIKSDLLSYDEQAQHIQVGKLGYNPREPGDALGIELALWARGRGYTAAKAAQVVHAAQQVDEILAAQGVQW